MRVYVANAAQVLGNVPSDGRRETLAQRSHSHPRNMGTSATSGQQEPHQTQRALKWSLRSTADGWTHPVCFWRRPFQP